MPIHYIPIASESIGVRSLSLFVETPDTRILIDAGVSLGPRFGLLPHPLEYYALKKVRNILRDYAEKADIITISHYHFDHYTAAWPNIEAKWSWSSIDEAKIIYKDKIILAKDYKNSINTTQRKRGYIFHKIITNFVKRVMFADSINFTLGDTKIIFSQPFPHGEDGTSLGYVLLLNIRHGDDNLLYCSDVQGPISNLTLQYILKINPKVLVISGPPIYLKDYKVDSKAIEIGLKNLSIITQQIPYTLIDHHILRSEEGLKEIDKFDRNRVKTFAEHLNLENNLLEAKRAKLYEENPPDKDFQKWLKLPPHQQRSQPPPI